LRNPLVIGMLLGPVRAGAVTERGGTTPVE